VLMQLLGDLDLEGVLSHVEALHTQLFLPDPGAGCRIFVAGQGEPEDAAPQDSQPVSGKPSVSLRGNGS